MMKSNQHPTVGAGSVTTSPVSAPMAICEPDWAHVGDSVAPTATVGCSSPTRPMVPPSEKFCGPVSPPELLSVRFDPPLVPLLQIACKYQLSVADAEPVQ